MHLRFKMFVSLMHFKSVLITVNELPFEDLFHVCNCFVTVLVLHQGKLHVAVTFNIQVFFRLVML